MTTKRATTLVIVMMLLVTSGCGIFTDDDLAEMELKVDAGRVRVIREGEVVTVADRLSLQTGDVITASRDARARLRLRGARQAELRGASETTIVDERSIDFEGSGNRVGLLAEVGETTTVAFGRVLAKASAATFRLDHGFGSSRLASYAGSVQVSSAGQSGLTVERLFQASITVNDLPDTARPYDLDPDDDWDETYAGQWLELDASLAELGSGLQTQLGRDRPGLDYFRALADRNVSFMRSYLKRRTSDLLIGFTIARQDQVDNDRSLEKSFRESFELRDRGGAWGVVAGILEVRPRPVLAQLEGIVDALRPVAEDGTGRRAVFTVAAAEASDAAGGGPGVVSQPPVGGGRNNNNGGNGRESPGPKPTTSPSPSESPPECDAECQVKDITDQLPTSSPSPTASPTTEATP